MDPVTIGLIATAVVAGVAAIGSAITAISSCVNNSTKDKEVHNNNTVYEEEKREEVGPEGVIKRVYIVKYKGSGCDITTHKEEHHETVPNETANNLSNVAGTLGNKLAEGVVAIAGGAETLGEAALKGTVKLIKNVKNEKSESGNSSVEENSKEDEIYVVENSNRHSARNEEYAAALSYRNSAPLTNAYYTAPPVYLPQNNNFFTHNWTPTPRGKKGTDHKATVAAGLKIKGQTTPRLGNSKQISHQNNEEDYNQTGLSASTASHTKPGGFSFTRFFSRKEKNSEISSSRDEAPNNKALPESKNNKPAPSLDLTQIIHTPENTPREEQSQLNTDRGEQSQTKKRKSVAFKMFPQARNKDTKPKEDDENHNNTSTSCDIMSPRVTENVRKSVLNKNHQAKNGKKKESDTKVELKEILPDVNNTEVNNTEITGDTGTPSDTTTNELT